MTLDTTRLTRAFHDATEDVTPRQGFTAAVVRSGRRRMIRKRALVAAGAAAITAIAGTGTYVLWPDAKPGEVQVADPLTQPTGGDLAGDSEFIETAVRAWRQELPRSRDLYGSAFKDLRGQPHVFWAGNTAAGPTAVVAQQAAIPDPGGGPGRVGQDWITTAFGLVATDPADGRLKLVGVSLQTRPQVAAGFLYGPDDRTVLIVAGSSPIYLATPRHDDPNGKIIRGWRRIPIDRKSVV